MKNRARSAALVMPVLLLIAGCDHKSVNQLSSAEAGAFDQAPPEVKAMWVQASDAVRTNGYVTGYNLFYDLINTDLSPDQKQAVTKESAALNERLLTAVDKGDPAAQAALQEMRRNPPSRRRAN